MRAGAGFPMASQIPGRPMMFMQPSAFPMGQRPVMPIYGMPMMSMPGMPVPGGFRGPMQGIPGQQIPGRFSP